MKFKTGYFGSMDRNYYEDKDEFPVSSIGTTVAEGQGSGAFRDSVQGAIRRGASTIELSASPEGQQQVPGTGFESYGREQREELRELARANEININSVHVPAQNVGNLSGLGQNGFSEEMRKTEMDEVRKGIRFAAEAAQGGAVVVHTGEFPRTIEDARWNKDGKWKDSFEAYPEEKQRAIKYLVDDRTGDIIKSVRKSQIVTVPKYKRNLDTMDYVDEEGNNIDIKKDPLKKKIVWNSEQQRFETETKTWKDIEEESKKWNKYHPHDILTPEEYFFRETLDAQEAQTKGWTLFHSQKYEEQKENAKKIKKALDFYNKLEDSMPEDEKWKLMRQTGHDLMGLIPPDTKYPSEILKKNLDDINQNLIYMEEGAAGYEAQAKDISLTRDHVTTIERYAKEKSVDSLSDLGIEAMKQSNSPVVKKDIYIAPENIFPEMGYGAHPEELIDFITEAREEMADKLQRNYGYSKSGAEKEAKDHIKATLDTQHMGMWRKHFKARPQENPEDVDKRFNKWYMDQVEKLEKAGIIGNVHVVDGYGYGHTHIPMGQGVMPVQSAVEYLLKKGYKGAINSEAYGEGPTRQLTKVWEAMGSPVYSVGASVGGGGSGPRWSDVEHSYFGRTEPPRYVFGSYSPSEDWTLWSGVKME